MLSVGKALDHDAKIAQAKKFISIGGPASTIVEALSRRGSVEHPRTNMPLFEQSVQEVQAEYISDGPEEEEEEEISKKEHARVGRDPTNI